MSEGTVDEKVSIIIPTYNRAQLLRECLVSLLGMQGVEENVEIVVVDNGSTDETRHIVSSFALRHRGVVYVEEVRSGLSQARNRGVKVASGGIVAFLDDDVEVHQSWLGALRQAFRNPRISAVGGRVLPPMGVNLPSWMPTSRMYLLSLFDNGDTPRRYTQRECFPGGNMALRKWLFVSCGLFDTSLGRKRRILLGGEEVALYRKIVRGGYEVWYWPDMIVYHKIADRIDPDWILNYASCLGRSDLRMDLLYGNKWKCLAKSVRSVTQIFGSGLRGKPMVLSQRHFEQSIRRHYAKGYLQELRTILDLRVWRFR
ncbi:MAG: glycosyltransferase [Bacillota bacterium]|nr:glycosyltransferase [Bacillota bacterium]